MGEACRPWVLEFCDAVFGAYNHETGRRLIREFFLLVSKKNAKSTLAAGIMLTALVRNWRQSAEFLIVAPTIEVAGNSFKPASDMIRASPDLSAIMHIQEHFRTITHLNTKATLRVVAADDATVGGKKATGVLVDELWLFGKRANAESILREATGGLASRPEGFVIYLSTQSDEPPAGVFRQKLNYFRDVRDGKVEDKRSLPVLYEFPEQMQVDKRYRDKTMFYVTNPNLGASVDEEFLEREFDIADRAGPESLQGFLAKHLNVEIGIGLRSDRWRGADHWLAATDNTLSLQALLERSEVIVAGVDGGGLDDLLGLTLVGREPGTRRWLSWTKAWVHRSVLDLRKSEAPRMRDFERDGDLVLVEDTEDAIQQLADIVSQVDDTGMLAQVGLDPMGVGLIVDALAERGIEGTERIKAVSQGWTLNGAIKTTEVKLASGMLVHADQGLARWAVENAKVEPKGNAITITKAVAGAGKIDPLMALFCAVALMSKNPEAPGISIYSDPNAYATVFGEMLTGNTAESWDPAVIRDVTHPDFAVHKARFEAWQAQQPDDDQW